MSTNRVAIGPIRAILCAQGAMFPGVMFRGHILGPFPAPGGAETGPKNPKDVFQKSWKNPKIQTPICPPPLPAARRTDGASPRDPRRHWRPAPDRLRDRDSCRAARDGGSLPGPPTIYHGNSRWLFLWRGFVCCSLDSPEHITRIVCAPCSFAACMGMP